eukprot:4723923-Amphidinium_carterae.2
MVSAAGAKSLFVQQRRVHHCDAWRRRHVGGAILIAQCHSHNLRSDSGLLAGFPYIYEAI